MSDVSEEEFQACNRETVVYHLDEVKPIAMETEDPPDEFFEVTESDMRALWADSQRKLWEIPLKNYLNSLISSRLCSYRFRREVEEQPLMTRALRQSLRTDTVTSRYGRVAIRVQFPDKFVVQALFRPRETVHSLYKFVAQLLADEKTSFHLCKQR